MELKFEFARKMNKPAKGASGITLRSINGDGLECSMVIMANEYKDIRAGLANYRMLTGCDISAITRGKSLEIKAVAASDDENDALDHIFDYAKTLKFNTEDALDVCEFYCEAFADKAFKPSNITLSPDSLSIQVIADIDNESEEDAIYSGLDAICSKYNVGIIKKRPGEL